MTAQAQFLKLWSQYRSSPLRFVTEVLKATPEPWQKDALEAVAVHDRVAIRSGHGVGKTTLIAWLSLWFLLTRYPCKIPVTANSQDQLRDTIWPELGRWYRGLEPYLKAQIDFGAERIGLNDAADEAFAVARTASKDNPEALQGFHSDHLLFLIDEASGIDDIVFEVAQGALSTPGAKVVMTGNPTRNSGFFYDAFHRSRARWHTMAVSSETVPRATGHIEDIIARYGKESNVYRVRVLGEFPQSEDDVVIPLHLCEAALERKASAILQLRVVWGVDVARFGSDRTALAKRRGNVQLEPVKSWRGKDTMQTAGLIKAEWDQTLQHERPSEILIDVIGIGAGVVDRCNELGLPVRGVNVAESPSVAERYMRLRDELWFKSREWLEARDCVLKDQALIAELTTVHYKVTSGGKLQVESKDDMKKRGMDSPDLADAWNLTFAGGLDRIPEEESDRYWRKKSNSRSWMSG